MSTLSIREATELISTHDPDRPERTLDRLLPALYDELRTIAHRHMARERTDHTLDTTELVHEAYLKMVDQSQLTWENRLHFFGIASRVMRNLLIDYARAHTAEKRGGGKRPLPIDDQPVAVRARAEELIALDMALDRLESFDERKARVVQYHFFGGLTLQETGDLLGVSHMTVHRDWKKAKAWLYNALDS